MNSEWAETLWRVSWQGALTVAGVWLICRLLRGLSANIRCWLWRLVFLKLAVALFWTVPLDVPVLPAPVRVASSPLTRATPPLPLLSSRHLTRDTRRPAPPSTAGSSLGVGSLIRVVQLLWLAGVALGLIGLAATWRRMLALRRGATRVEDPALLREMQEVARLLGLRPAPALLTYKGPMPLLVGALRPAVLLPRDLQITREERRLVLGHELAHAQRRDLLWAWLPTLVRCLYFFHPLVWLAHREARLAQEAATDELTLRVTGAPVGVYAQMLVDLTAGRAPALAGLGAAGILETGMLLERRIEMLEQIAVVRSRKGTFAGALLLVSGCGLVLPWRVVAQEPPSGGNVKVPVAAAGINIAQGDARPAWKNLDKIQPPGGAPLFPGVAGHRITVEAGTRASKRLESAPAEELDKWIVELERITGKTLSPEIEKAGCRTYFVSQMGVAFDDLEWNAEAAGNLFQRAQTMPASEVRIWKEAFETVLGKEIERAYRVPLVLLPVEALHEGQKYSAERGKKYRERLKQLTAEDVALWIDKVDVFLGSELDAAVNIVLLDDFFTSEKFQRDRFHAAIKATKK